MFGTSFFERFAMKRGAFQLQCIGGRGDGGGGGGGGSGGAFGIGTERSDEASESKCSLFLPDVQFYGRTV